jgi:hypothetical protein
VAGIHNVKEQGLEASRKPQIFVHPAASSGAAPAKTIGFSNMVGLGTPEPRAWPAI